VVGNKTVKVLHVISGLGTGGAETMLSRLVRKPTPGLEQRVISLTPGGPVRQQLEQAGVWVQDVGLRFPEPMPLLRLALHIRRWKPDVVQGWMYHGDLASSLALTLSGRRNKTVSAWGIRCSNMDLSLYGRQLRWVVRLCARFSNQPDLVIANSRAGKDSHAALGYHPRQWAVVHNGLDLATYNPDPTVRGQLRASVRQELDLPSDAAVFAMVARVDPMKNHAGLFRALEEVPDARALLAGAGTEALPAHPRIRALGRRDDVPRLLAACDAVVSPSLFGEGFSNALAEGMAAGCLPVATDVGDAAAILGTCGWLLAPNDNRALADSLEEICALSANDRAQAGQTAAAHIHRRFTVDACQQAFLRLYNGVPTNQRC
jgi:glycosyltransferase involved in cell wall biosynthesis